MQFTNLTAHNEPAHDTTSEQIEGPRVRAPLPPQFDQCCYPIGEPRTPGFRYRAEPVARGAVRILHVTEAPRGGVLTYLFNLIKEQVVSSEIELVHVLGPSVNEPVLRQCRSPKLRVDSIRYERRSWRTLLRLGVATLRTVRQV
jgi:hypothetical protein